MFVLTQCIEVSVAPNRALSIAFLDTKEAYDNIDSEILWDILKHEGIDDDFVELLKVIYIYIETTEYKLCGKVKKVMKWWEFTKD